MKRIFIILFSVLLILACNLPAPAAVEFSTPTLQTYPTVTIPPVHTATPFPSLAPTPDIRVITASSQVFKLRLEDLPSGYTIRYIPSCRDDTDPHCRLASDTIEGPNYNYEILQDLGFEQGSKYINDTLRVESWYIYYSNENSYGTYPQTIMNNIIRFTNSAGAQKYMDNYADMSITAYTQVQGYLQVGDTSRAYSRTYYNWKYLIYEFSYKNIVQRIWFAGTEANITPDLVHDLAFKALKRLQAAELDFPPQFTSPPTLTPSAHLSPSPDQRIITAHPIDFILTEFDLPPEGEYHLPDKYASSPHHNNEVIQLYQDGKGSNYINETNRVDGWIIRYKRGANNLLLPVEMYDNVIMYQTTTGAKKSITEFAATFLGEGWHEGIPQQDIGDVSRLFIKQEGVYIKYLLEFSYRNYAHRLQAYGLQAEVDPAFMEMVAFTLLQKLQSAPLSP